MATRRHNGVPVGGAGALLRLHELAPTIDVAHRKIALFRTKGTSVIFGSVSRKTRRRP
jgi:hypothetical protein